VIMSDVKRYEAVHLRYDDNNIRYGEGCEVEVVPASDYATLESELTTVQGVNAQMLEALKKIVATPFNWREKSAVKMSEIALAAIAVTQQEK